MLRFSKFSLREREARKWTFVRDWEKEPTPSEQDFRTSVSPLAEIITSPPPEVVSLPGGRQVVRGSPVPVLLNTSISSDHNSTKKSQLHGRQLSESSYHRGSPHRSVHEHSGHHSKLFPQSKRDNSGEEQEDLPADNDSTQNNPSSNSDVVSVGGAPVDGHSVLGRNQSVGEVGGGGLVGVREYREVTQREQGTDSQSYSVSSRQNQSLCADNAQNRGRGADSHSRIQTGNSLSSGAEESNEMVTNYSTNPGQRAHTGRAKKQPTPNKQPAPQERDIPHCPQKKKKQTAEQSDIQNQSVVQLAVETPVQPVKRKLVKPRVILAGCSEGEEKKKKVRIRDRHSELAIQMWVGKDCDRCKKDVLDLDIIMHNIMETLNQCREKFSERPQQRALDKFLVHIHSDIVTQIESKENVAELNSNMRKSKKNVQSLRKELQGLQNKKDSLLEKIERAESESVTCGISRWMYGFQKLVKKNRTLIKTLSTIEEEDFVKII